MMLQEIERFQENVSILTRYSNRLRMYHLDNLDESLANAQDIRNSQNDSLFEALKIRTSNMQKCDSMDVKNKETLTALKQLNQSIKQMVDANALLGDNQSKAYEKSLKHVTSAYELIALNHENLIEFYVVEANWSKPILSKTNKQTKRLKAELDFEENRFKVKEKLIKERNLSYKELLTNLSKSNRDFKTKLKLQMKATAKYDKA